MRKGDHHIWIKNLRTQTKEGFLLASGDAPYSVQGVDNIAQRVADGEILYSDFTNSRVFAQSDWGEGISKYWDPERLYSVVYPSKKYRDKKNVIIGEGEFTLGGSVKTVQNLSGTDPRGPMCVGEEAGVVYLGSGMTIYRSTDYGVNFSLWKDFTGDARLVDVDEITDIIYITPKDILYTHPSPMGSGTCSGIQELFVCFYNRTTKKSAVARYDVNFIIRAASGYTYINGWGSSVSVAYGSKRESISIATSDLSNSTTIAITRYSGQTCGVVGNWKTLGLFPGQKLKVTRTFNGVVYNCVVNSIGDVGGIGDLVIGGIPGFSTTSFENNYTAEISRTSDTLCVPCTTIAVYTTVGLGLGQNIIYNGILYNIYGLGNGRTFFGNIPTFFPGGGTDTKEYVMLKRIDGGSAWNGLYGNGTLNIPTEKWLYHFGTYNNIITKFVYSSGSRAHLWGFNKIHPTNKLYDVGYGEITTNAANSNIYANSLIGALHSAQNHTITFLDGSSPISGSGTTDYTMFIGTQNGSLENGTQSSLIKFTLNAGQTMPTYATVGVVGEQGISAMAYLGSLLYLGTNKKGYIYEWNDSQNVLTQIAKLPVLDSGFAYIDAMEIYMGKIVISYQKSGGVYQIDPNTRQNQSPLIEADVLCSGTTDGSRVYNICNTGGSLLFTSNKQILGYDEFGIADTGYMESSIYGGYISNVEKLWVYGYIRVEKWYEDSGRVALEASFDGGRTWYFCPTKKNKPFVQVLDWNNPLYSVGYNEQDNEQLTFLFPYNTKSGTISYRAHLKKNSTTGKKSIVNHVSIHYNLNYKQELLFNYQIDLNKASELLTGRDVEVDRQNDKLEFLKEIWQNQDMVELTDVNGKTYICIPFSDERTPGQGLVIGTSNSNTAHKDLDNLVYKVVFGLKTVANYDKIL